MIVYNKKGEIFMKKLFKKIDSQIVKNRFRKESSSLTEGQQKKLDGEIIFGNLFEELSDVIELENQYKEIEKK